MDLSVKDSFPKHGFQSSRKIVRERYGIEYLERRNEGIENIKEKIEFDKTRNAEYPSINFTLFLLQLRYLLFLLFMI